jgi:hydroxymethylglutaryl-CoA synthase
VTAPCGQGIGIDDLSVYVPKLYLPATGEFAASRGIDPAKLIRGIGIERMAVPDAHEDAATMAAQSMLELMQRNDLSPEEIGKIYVGTESGVDEAKALGTYVIGMLEKVYGPGAFQDCSTVEFKSACIGATHALENICYWAAADDEGRSGIVIASDIARYPLRSSGEYTQGAGSVSLLVKRNPRLLALDRSVGAFTRDENDFFRPTGCSTAVVNGKHSNSCYLNAMEGAFAAYARGALKRGMIKLEEGKGITDYISHLLFHIPYPRMVEYAALAVFRLDWKGLPRWKEIEAEIGAGPSPGDFDSSDSYQAADAGYAKRFSRTKQFIEAFKSKVEDTTQISRQVGNIYTGSLYLGLASLAESRRLIPGERVAFGSYGSGCSAMVFSGIVVPGAESIPLRDIWKRLDERRAISLDEYETLHEGRRRESILPLCGEFALVEIDGQGYRHYDYMR